MFGIVIVSHSRDLASSLAGLLGETASAPVPVAYAGGAGGSRELAGTDATDILSAIESVYSDEGVLVFTDTGSSILSTELAIDFLDDKRRGNVFLTGAPMAEGAIAAAALCAAGADIHSAIREAEESLVPKKEMSRARNDENGKGEAGEVASGKGDGIQALQGSERGFGDDAMAEDKARNFPPGSPCTPGIKDIPGSKPGLAGEDARRGKSEIRLVLKNTNGLHARPASRFIGAISPFRCSVEVTNLTTGKGPADGRSINRLASLELLEGHEMLVSVTGDNPGDVTGVILRLYDNNFGDPVSAKGGISLEYGSKKGGSSRHLPGETTPFPFSAGIAAGKVLLLDTSIPEIPYRSADDPVREEDALLEAFRTVGARTAEMAGELEKRGKKDESEILMTHLSILHDPDICGKAIGLIREMKCTALYAYSIAVSDVLRLYGNISDPVLGSREADVREVALSVFAELGEKKGYGPALEGRFDEREIRGMIIAARDVTPAAVSMLFDAGAAGLILEGGSPVSHAAIMARSLGIPGAGGYRDYKKLREGDFAAVDGYDGAVFINPEKDLLCRLEKKKEDFAIRARALLENAGKKAITEDGFCVPVYANISTPREAELAVEMGADGIGVIRTEFLFINSERELPEEEQYRYFREILSCMGDRPVTIRTFDIGGDKNVPFMKLPHEDNPYLGMRGSRLYREYREMLHRQLCAALRAGEGHDISIMFPMITAVGEFMQMKEILSDVHKCLENKGEKHKWPVAAGIMIETPSSAIISDRFSRLADFFSIGTNDLTQYIMSAERGRENLSSYADPFSPAVLRAIHRTCCSASAAGIPVSLCGEMGADPLALSLIIGLGVIAISASPDRIPSIKDSVRKIDRKKAINDALGIIRKADGPDEVREMLGKA